MQQKLSIAIVLWLMLSSLGCGSGDPTPRGTETPSLEPRGTEVPPKRAPPPRPTPSRAVEEAVNDLDSDDKNVRVNALRDLALHGEVAREVVPRLVDMVETQGPQQHERLLALRAIGKIGGHGDRVLPLLVDLIKSENSQIFIEATRALGIYGTSATTAVEPLMATIDRGDSTYAEVVGETLGKITDDPVSELLKRLEDPNFYVRSHVGVALAMFSTEAYPPLRARLDSSAAKTRATAAEALRGFGNHATGAVERLIELIDDSDPEVRAQALWALSNIDPHQKKLVPRLRRLLREEKERKPYFGTVTLLGAMGPLAEPALPELIDALRLPLMRAEARHGVESALRSIGEPAIPALVDALDDPFRAQGACAVLGSMGARAKGAVKALEKTVETTDDPRLRGAAESALSRIER